MKRVLQAAPSLAVDVQRPGRVWAPPRSAIALWAGAARGRAREPAELSVRVVGRAESQRLNQAYRGKDRPTNVLSFPVRLRARPQPLGDLVVCAAVLRAEAREQGKALRAHWAHLIVHGVLHLIGFDHVRAADARRMERREIAVLRRLGFPNPYIAPRPAPRRRA